MNHFLKYFIILLIKLNFIFTNKCPQECICKNNNRDVSCVHKGLRNIPQNIPLTVERLDLSKNNFLVLNDKSFINFTNLKILLLQNCKIEKISIDTFYGLINLKQITLSNNYLSKFDESTFKNLTNLLHLNFANNKFEAIPSFICKSMTKLNLADNKISNITIGAAFKFNKNLRSLVLTKNIIKSIVGSDLDNLEDTGIESLTLTINDLQYIDQLAFKPLIGSLKSLKLDGNVQLTSKVLEESLMIFKNSTKLNNLNLKNTAITNISNHFFHPFLSAPLNFLDLSSNSKFVFIDEDAFSGLQHLRRLNLEKCKLSSASIQFKHLTNLKELHLNHNNLPHCPSSFPKSVEFIDISYNYITSIRKDDFKGLSLLKALKISNNEITSIEDDSFLDLNQLESFDISYNDIETLQYSKKGIFSEALNLSYLNLSHNKINKWSSKTFTGIASTILDINLSFNHIEFISLNISAENYFPMSFKKLKRIALKNNSWNCSCSNVQWILDHKNIVADPDNVNCEYPNNTNGKNIFDINELKNCTSNKLTFPSLYWVAILLVTAIFVVVFFSTVVIKRKKIKRWWLIRRSQQNRYRPLLNETSVSPIWMSSVKATEYDSIEDVVLLSVEINHENDNLNITAIDNLQLFANKVTAYHCKILVIDYPPLGEDILKYIVSERLKEHGKNTYVFYGNNVEYNEDNAICRLLEETNIQKYTDIVTQLYKLF